MENELRIGGREEAILIAGPTASGKSRLALRLAERHGGEIVNADSMQVYGVLRVLTARPGEDETAGIPHHLYGHVAPDTDYSTGRWLDEAEAAIAGIRARGRLPIVIGGTGLYFRALTGGLSDIPPVPAEIRAHWRAELERSGVAALHAELARRDPELAARLKPADRQRILRAVEVHAATGRSLGDFQTRTGKVVVPEDKTARIVLMPDRALLHDRINRRFLTMLEDGAIEEVKSLLSLNLSSDRPVMKAIGVREIAGMLDGDLDRATVIERASAATRQYAKRQMTWMRNQFDDGWQRMTHLENERFTRNAP
jgi:tRNA dimethylallyltransferase